MPRTTAAEGRGDGRRERWTSHRALRHREFVDAAVRVIAREGPELSMDAVAAEAGVTKPVLYRYFEDKAALLRSLDERGAELLFTRLLPAISTDGPGLARVRAAVGAYFEVIDEFPNLYWLIARQPLAVRDDGVPVDEHDEFIAGALAGIMVEVLAAFDLDVAAAQPWAHGLTGLVRSSGEWWLRQARSPTSSPTSSHGAGPAGPAAPAAPAAGAGAGAGAGEVTRAGMTRDTVVEHVTHLIWAGLSGILADAGIVVDPEQPFSAARRARPADLPAGAAQRARPERPATRDGSALTTSKGAQ